MFKLDCPKISIITVSYNCKSALEDTIINVSNLSYPNFDFIIIDGGSVDGTVDVIKKHQQKLTYWISEPDNGIYDAMKQGLGTGRFE